MILCLAGYAMSRKKGGQIQGPSATFPDFREIVAHGATI
jgi:hypothetical protein